MLYNIYDETSLQNKFLGCVKKAFNTCTFLVLFCLYVIYRNIISIYLTILWNCVFACMCVSLYVNLFCILTDVSYKDKILGHLLTRITLTVTSEEFLDYEVLLRLGYVIWTIKKKAMGLSVWM